MIEIEQLRGWIGRREERTDVVAPAVIDRLAALLDHETPPWRTGVLPPLGHWLFHLPDAPQGAIGVDGHPERGGFLPPVPLPKRMWAGSRIAFDGDIPIGAEIVRRSTIADVVAKGAAGHEKVFVTVVHEILCDGIVRITDTQDIVYLDDAPKAVGDAAPVPKAPRDADGTRRLVADAVMLFRYSALTFNAHRIHYDRDYATGVEGYAGLVVHGPLLATLLLDHYLRAHPAARVDQFAFRARMPLFDAVPFELCSAETATGASLWTLDARRGETMTATLVAG